LIFGIFGTVFGILGIFTFGLLFVPLGIICTIISFFRKDGILIGLLSLLTNIVACVVSPTIWLLLLSIFTNTSYDQNSNTIQINNSHLNITI
jgi:hypothetical protein